MNEVPSCGYEKRFAVVEAGPLTPDDAKVEFVFRAYSTAHAKAVELSQKKPGAMFRIYEMLSTVTTTVTTHTQTTEAK